MAVTRTGSVESFGPEGQTANLSVTVPADATCVVVIANPYKTATNWMATNPFSLGGSNLTTIQKTDEQTDNCQLWIGYLVNPLTGARTLALDWGTTIEYGSPVVVIYYKSVDTGDPIRSSGQQLTTETDVTGLTAFAGDMMVGGVGSSNTIIVTDNSQTELYNDIVDSDYLGVAEKDGATGFYFSDGDYTTAVALVLKAAAEGGDPHTYYSGPAGTYTRGVA